MSTGGIVGELYVLPTKGGRGQLGDLYVMSTGCTVLGGLYIMSTEDTVVGRGTACNVSRGAQW